jgi:formyltetrahydrofolate hydrolase
LDRDLRLHVDILPHAKVLLIIVNKNKHVWRLLFRVYVNIIHDSLVVVIGKLVSSAHSMEQQKRKEASIDFLHLKLEATCQYKIYLFYL